MMEKYVKFLSMTFFLAIFMLMQIACIYEKHATWPHILDAIER
eukprot:jgi/Antlo1/1916/2468